MVADSTLGIAVVTGPSMGADVVVKPIMSVVGPKILLGPSLGPAVVVGPSLGPELVGIAVVVGSFVEAVLSLSEGVLGPFVGVTVAGSSLEDAVAAGLSTPRDGRGEGDGLGKLPPEAEGDIDIEVDGGVGVAEPLGVSLSVGSA